ncbi:hypothetical protein EI42_02375 [Thermosporothrix hazakensis]|jgi:hypothetical protein|uniref:Uncharacterized protein n=1 Tax=Thermosporothrix hazakensis TaxID=644383 RepID=A0A326U886_THEHA|nr:hypothetical protein [Thermosporothrix hazakensis]PZW31278.1 hypothetical protein EI42_02375 [Thermosporothrix hazakensis]GCE50808.1 hypothetical protein KTH_56770 [Thermosporothrix hazakensis]
MQKHQQYDGHALAALQGILCQISVDHTHPTTSFLLLDADTYFFYRDSDRQQAQDSRISLDYCDQWGDR